MTSEAVIVSSPPQTVRMERDEVPGEHVVFDCRRFGHEFEVTYEGGSFLSVGLEEPSIVRCRRCGFVTDTWQHEMGLWSDRDRMV